MSLPPEPSCLVPECTSKVAHAAFPHGNRYMQMREAFGTLYTNAQFADLYPAVGQPAEAPWRLALVTIMQFTENLTDRQAAEAVRGRIDWKYALGLELTDAGFDFSVLSKDPRRLRRGFQEEGIYHIGGICPPNPLTRMPFLPTASSGASWHDFVSFAPGCSPGLRKSAYSPRCSTVSSSGVS